MSQAMDGANMVPVKWFSTKSSGKRFVENDIWKLSNKYFLLCASAFDCLNSVYRWEAPTERQILNWDWWLLREKETETDF